MDSVNESRDGHPSTSKVSYKLANKFYLPLFLYRTISVINNEQGGILHNIDKG